MAVFAAVSLTAFLWIIPLFFVLLNSFKTNAEYLASKIAFPSVIAFSNYAATMVTMRYLRSFGNSFLITVCSVTGLLALSILASYKIARVEGKLSTAVFLLFLCVFVVPFQSIMIPIVVTARAVGLMNKLIGLIIVYWGLVTPTAIFMYRGFIYTIPVSLEESARLDGANTPQILYHILFPLLKPITSTIAVLLSLQTWNDFLLPLLLLQSPEKYTIPLATMRFFQSYNTAWANILAAAVLGSLPMIILFFTMQRHVISGIINGAVKT
jgi:raffinose/stachyose/melibiose transport system permease protein